MPTRFVIVGTARTGSNLLARSLNRPPHVRCFGELAKTNYAAEPDAFVQLQKLTGRGREDLAAVQTDDVVQFIFDIVYKVPADAVGFKLFYEHCRDPPRRPLWRRLEAEPSIRIVHLTRRAVFDLYLSLLYAERTGRWLARPEDPGGQPNDLEDIEVDVDHCRAFFERYETGRRRATELFRAHPCLEIDYESLRSDLPEAVSAVRAFIGVDQEQGRPAPLRKQASRSPAEKVRNHAAVKAAFADSVWAAYFAEA